MNRAYQSVDCAEGMEGVAEIVLWLGVASHRVWVLGPASRWVRLAESVKELLRNCSARM